MRRIAAALLLCLPCALQAQTLQIGSLSAPASRSRSYIVYAAEPQNVPAGRPTVLDLRFQVVDGFHVNSHTPKSDLLIPTQLTFEPAPGVKTAALQYPAGTSYSFRFSPGDILDVYSGAFTVKLPLRAEAGQHTLQGTLHYQACDHAACYPPKNLPVQVVFTAK